MKHVITIAIIISLAACSKNNEPPNITNDNPERVSLTDWGVDTFYASGYSIPYDTWYPPPHNDTIYGSVGPNGESVITHHGVSYVLWQYYQSSPYNRNSFINMSKTMDSEPILSRSTKSDYQATPWRDIWLDTALFNQPARTLWRSVKSTP